MLEPAEEVRERAEPASAGASPRRGVGLWLILLGASMIVLGAGWAQLRSSEGSTFGAIAGPAEVVRVDEPAPDFELPLLAGEGTLRLTSMRGSVVVLNFWASWCGPCRQEAPGLQATFERYADQNVRFLGVDFRDNVAAGQAFVREFGITYPSVSDASGSLGGDFALLGLPATFVIDEEGVMRYRFTGYVTEAFLRDALDDVVSESTS